MAYIPGQKTRTLNIADEQKVVLMFGGRKVMEIEFSVSEQKLDLSVYGNTGSVSNPVFLSVDTQMLRHTEDEE